MGYDEHPTDAFARYECCAPCARYGRQSRQTAPSPTQRRSHNTRRRFAASGARQGALPVPTSFQFGSREVVSRANVQTSVMSATLSGLPSTIVPALSRVTEIICDTKGAVAGFRTHKFSLVDRHESRLRLLLVLLAIPDHSLETLIDFGRQ